MLGQQFKWLARYFNYTQVNRIKNPRIILSDWQEKLMIVNIIYLTF